ncbi:MAG: hypothetical protein ABIN83_02535 [Sphingomicrobium sp.]
MAKNSSLINYHASRAMEEQEKAIATSLASARDSHLALSQLHLSQADNLRVSEDDATASSAL